MNTTSSCAGKFRETSLAGLFYLSAISFMALFGTLIVGSLRGGPFDDAPMRLHDVLQPLTLASLVGLVGLVSCVLVMLAGNPDASWQPWENRKEFRDVRLLVPLLVSWILFSIPAGMILSKGVS